jgi:hypothetical protein
MIFSFSWLCFSKLFIAQLWAGCKKNVCCDIKGLGVRGKKDYVMISRSWLAGRGGA